MKLLEQAHLGHTRHGEEFAFDSQFRNLTVLTETIKPKIAP